MKIHKHWYSKNNIDRRLKNPDKLIFTNDFDCPFLEFMPNKNYHYVASNYKHGPRLYGIWNNRK